MFNTFIEAQEWIENSHRFGDKLDLRRMNIACKLLGNPQNAFRSIHVAGTNGKGSTTNYIKNILVDAGYKVGIYTSPYVVKFNERIGIDNDYISDEDVLRYANELVILWEKVYQEYDEAITFFEILTLMCFMYFRDEAIDFGVIEVGLGGLLDATNVITPVVSVITNISFDHMKQLGNTLESIALNKLGIVKQNVPLVTSIEEKTLFSLFIEETKKKNAAITFVDFSKLEDVLVGEETTFTYRNSKYSLQLPGYHQIKNAALAIDTIHVFENELQLHIPSECIQSGLSRTLWPGRFEIFHHNIILDGAHNIGGIESLEATVKTMYKDKYIKCLFCMMKDKEHYKVIKDLDDLVDEFHFTEIPYPRRADAIELYQESNHPLKWIHHDFKIAFENLSKLETNQILLVTGSLYFISEIRKLLVES